MSVPVLRNSALTHERFVGDVRHRLDVDDTVRENSSGTASSLPSAIYQRPSSERVRRGESAPRTVGVATANTNHIRARPGFFMG